MDKNFPNLLEKRVQPLVTTVALLKNRLGYRRKIFQEINLFEITGVAAGNWQPTLSGGDLEATRKGSGC